MRIRLPTLAGILVVLAACSGDDHEDLKHWMAEASKDMRGRVQPIPEIKPFPIVSYDAADLPEPFSAGKVVPEKRNVGGGIQPDFDRPREPLEAYPLESLKMVGVVRKGKVIYGLVQADRMVHQVRTGNHIGQSFGVITLISEVQMSIKELAQDPSGETTDWVERLATLQLQDQADPQKEGMK
jgi:type IV pilus assembly protein PilP